mgnify:CR=1 FL=1
MSNIIANWPKDKPLKLNLGCYNKPIPGHINIDIRPPPETSADLVENIKDLPSFKENSIDEILCVHTIEHFPRTEILPILKRWHSLLKKDGLLRLAVPNMLECMKHYLYFGDLKQLLTTLGGSQRHQYDFHLSHFDQNTLTKLMLEAEFKNIQWWDWTKTPYWYCDSYASSYLPEGKRVYKEGRVEVEGGRLFSLNLEGRK